MWFDKTQTMKPQGTLFLIYLTSVSPFYSAAPRFEYPIRSSSTSRAAFLPPRIAHTDQGLPPAHIACRVDSGDYRPVSVPFRFQFYKDYRPEISVLIL